MKFRRYGMKFLTDWTKQYPSLKILDNDLKMSRLAQAYLILGDGEEIWQCVGSFACALHCKENKHLGCGECRVCSQIKAERFVDLQRVQASGKAKFIKKEDIIRLQNLVQTKPVVSSLRICFIQDAQFFDKEAANAFLKILEEPPNGTLWMLSASNLYSVFETLVSRCRRVFLNAISIEKLVSPHLEGQQEIQTFILQILKDPHQEVVAAAIDKVSDCVHNIKHKDKGTKEYLDYILGLVSFVVRDSAVMQVCYDSDEILLWPGARDVSEEMSTYLSSNMLDCLMERLADMRQNMDYNINLKLSLSYLFSALTKGML